MTTYYVSKDGDDGNAGTTLAAAFRNLSAAYTAATDDDTILFDDGTFTDSEIELSALAGYALFGAKSLTIGAVNPGSVTLNASVVTATFRWSTDMSGKTVTITGLGFDVEGGAETDYHIWWRNTGASKGTLNITNCTFADADVRQINCSNATERVDLTVTNCTSTSAITKNTRSFVGIPTLTDGNIVITDNTCTILNQNNSQGTVYVNAVASGPTFLAERNTFNQTQNTLAGAFLFPVVSVYNIDGATVQNSTINCTSTGGSAAGALVVLDCDSATLTANNNVIRKITGTIDCDDNGYGVLIGHDTTGGDGDDRCNNGIIEDCNVTGSAAFVAGGGHGVMLGNNTGGIQRRNTVSLFAIGVLQKGTTDAQAYGNVIKQCGTSYMQHKGCTDSAFYNNTVILDGTYSGGGYIANVNTATNNSGVIAKNNLIYAKENTSSAFVSVSSSQDATLNNNGYYAEGTAPAAVASFQGTNYSTLEAYISAQESASVIAPPDFVDFPTQYRIKEASKFSARGVDWFGSDVPLDYYGNKFSRPPTIGAVSRPSGGASKSRPRVVVKNFTPLGFGANHDTFKEITEGVTRVRIGKRRAVKVGRRPKIRIT